MACKSGHSSRGTVLIIDDSNTHCELCQIFLELDGFQVDIAGNSRQGLDAARQARPDVVLLDIMMPIMDGFQVLKQLKTDPVTRDIPVLVHSVQNETRTVVKALRMGADDFLKKPFDIVELIARVGRLVAVKHIQDALLGASRALMRRQQVIDGVLKKLGQDAASVSGQRETNGIKAQAGADAACKLEQAITDSERAIQLVSRILDLSRYNPTVHEMITV